MADRVVLFLDYQNIYMSARTLFHPIVQNSDARAEVAAWSNPQGYSRRLSIKAQNLWCHWLDEDDYHKVQDTRDYAIP